MVYSLIIVTPPDHGNIDGVSTFCLFLSEGLAQSGIFSISVVTPSSEIHCQTLKEYKYSNKVSYFKCPIPNGDNGIGLYLNALSDGSPCLILLNYWPSIFNIRSIRSHIPEATIVQIVHDFPWLTIFEGNTEYFFNSYNSDFRDFNEYDKKFLKYTTYDTLVSFKETDHIICLCRDSFRIINKNYQIPLQKIHLVPNGLADKYLDIVDNQDVSNKISDTIKILFIGRPTISKGWDRVIDLAIHLKKNNIDAKIICVGFTGISNLIPKNLISYFVETGIIPHDKIDDLYRQANFVFIPTRHEQCSYVAIEAMMHGKEIVAFDSFGLRNMLDDECAYIIDSVCQFPLHSLRKGEHARKHYMNRFSADSVIMNYTKLLTQIIRS